MAQHLDLDCTNKPCTQLASPLEKQSERERAFPMYLRGSRAGSTCSPSPAWDRCPRSRGKCRSTAGRCQGVETSIDLEAREFPENRDLGLGDTSPGPVDACHRCRGCPRG